jgi:hypothetical protein
MIKVIVFFRGTPKKGHKMALSCRSLLPQKIRNAFLWLQQENLQTYKPIRKPTTRKSKHTLLGSAS